MARKLLLLCGVALVAAVSACTHSEELGSDSSDLISDQEHNGGTAGFFFLPPVVPRPGHYGDFVPTAVSAVTLKIDEVVPSTGAVLHAIATYTETTGPNNEYVRVHPKNTPGDDGDMDPEGYFVVRFRTSKFTLSPAATYRISVGVPGRQLGYADIDLVTTKKEFKSVDTDNYAPLIDGDVLRIKFRVDRPSVDGDLDGLFDWADNCPSVANPGQQDSNHDGIGDACSATGTLGVAGGTITSPQGITLTVPEGAVDHPTTITVSTTTQAPPSGIGAVSPVYKFEPEGLVFTKPVTVTLPLPAGVSSGSVYWSRIGAPGFDSLGGTITGSTIAVRTVHFSLAVIGSASGTRLVTGVNQTTWISGTAALRESVPVTTLPEALVSDGAGGLVSIQAVAGALPGTFEIHDVPVGEYILRADGIYLVTSSDSIDLGSQVGGRTSRTAIENSTTLTMNVIGMDPWQTGDSLEVFSTEADNWDFETQRLSPPTDGDTTLTLPLDLLALDASAASTIEGSRPIPDRMALAQLTQHFTPGGVRYQSMSRVAALPLFDLHDGDQLAVSAAMANVSTASSIALDYRAYDFAHALELDGNPQFTPVCPESPTICGGFAGVLAQAGLAADGFYNANADLLLVWQPDPVNVTTGPMGYGSTAALPGDAWGTLFSTRWAAKHAYRLPDTSGSGLNTTVTEAIDWTTTEATAAAVPITPLITPAQNIKVDGIDFFAGASSIGTTPTLTWDAPRHGTPAFYSIGVAELRVNPANNFTQRIPIAVIVTQDRSFTLPSGILAAGHTYAFGLTAAAASSPDAALQLATAPFRAGLDTGSARVHSGIFGSAHGTHYADVTPIASGQSFPVGLVADGDGVFWTERADAPWDPPTNHNAGTIWRSDLSGSNIVALATGQDEPQSIAKDGTTLYWSNVGSNSSDGTIMSLDLADPLAAPQVVLSNESAGAMIVVDHDLYFSSSHGGIWVRHASDGTTTQFATMGATNLASDGSKVYWTVYGTGPGDSGEVLSLSLTTPLATPDTLATDQPQAWDIHTTGGNVYWSNQAGSHVPDAATIDRVSNTGTGATPLATGNEIMKVFAIDATNAYYVSDGILWSVPLAGGAATVLKPLDEGGCPEGNMAVAGGAIYWTDTCGNAVYRAVP